jgi:hypothetical protein
VNTVLVAAIWAVAFVTVCGLFLWQFAAPIKRLIGAHQGSIEARNQAKLTAALERQNATELKRATATEQAELRRAELKQQAAEAEAAAEVARATVPAQVAEQEKIIAARAEGRALAAKDNALKGNQGGSGMEALMEAYATYRNTGGHCAMDEWLGDLRIEGGNLV